jgi:transcriptional regulator with PAS, ATPase and Fis domain
MLVLEQGKYLELDDVKKYLKDFRLPEEERNLPVPLVGRSVEQAERELIFRALLDIKGNLIELRTLLAKQQPESSRGDHTVREPEENQTLSLQDMEQRMITEALERYKGNRRVAARALNISERTLYRKIKEFGLE